MPKRGGMSAAVIERGPVHAAAKLSAKAEGAAGAAVFKIVDRIVKGWGRPTFAYGGD